MEVDCIDAENSNYYQKRYAESDNGLAFVVGPGGRAAVVTMQISDEPQAPASQQISSSQETPSAIIVPLSPTTLSNDASAAVTETSGTLMDTKTQSPPSASSFYAPATALESTISVAAYSVLPASASTDGAFVSSGAVTESSFQASLPTTVSSEAVNLKPPIYAGIALGTIAGIACFTALIAWWIRIRSHAKRRRLYGDTDVPWAPSENADSGLEEARDIMQTRSNLESIGLGGREDLAQVEAWEPRGDRDVGEPRRSESYPTDSVSSSRHFVPLVHDSYPCRASPAIPGQHDTFLPFIQPFQDGPYPNVRPLPSYLHSAESSSSGSADDHTASSSLGPLRVANLLPGDRSVATSRAATSLGMNNHAYSIGTEDLDDLLAEADRSTLDQRSYTSYSWTNSVTRRETDTKSEKYKQTAVASESEGWTASLKSIFTVMASNLSIRSKSIRKHGDTLTPMPPRRSARGSTCSRDDRSTSGDKMGFRESNTEQDAHAETDLDANSGTCGPQLPPTSRRSAKSGQLRRDLLTRNARQDQLFSSQDTLSRASSVYSTSSAAFSDNTLSRNSTQGSLHSQQGTAKSGEKLSIRRPPAVARVSSTGCSVASSQLTDNEEAAQMALIDRRRRARRQDEWAERECGGN